MTDIPLPSTGSTNWSGWGAEQEGLSDQIRNLGGVNVKDYGAVGDGSTNDYTAVAAAVTAADTRSSSAGIVYFPPGIYAINQKLSVPANIYLVGEHAYASAIKLTAASSIPTFIEFGAAGAISTYTGVRNLQVDANSKANTAVLIHGPQEGSGIDQSFVIGALDRAAHFDGAGVVGGSNMAEIARSWLWTQGNAAMYGLYVTGGIVHVRSSTFVGVNRSIAAPAGSAGIAVVDGFILDQGNNAEQWESGRRLTRSTAQILTPESSTTSYGVTTSSDSTNTALWVSAAGWSNSVADINDAGQSTTITYANSYLSNGPASSPRHFMRGIQALKHVPIYKSDSEQATVGYYSPSTGEAVHFKQTVLTPALGWVVGGFTDGNDGTNGAWSSAWNGPHHRIGNFHLWVDATSKLRMKNGAPTSDTDGTVVGTQT